MSIKNYIRSLNHQRIDAGKALLLKLAVSLFDKPPLSRKIPPRVKNILVLHIDDKIGDLVVNSILFRELLSLFPEAKIQIVVGPNSYPLIASHSGPKKVWLCRKGFWNTLVLAWRLRLEKFDLVCDTRTLIDARTMFILNSVRGKFVTGFHKSRYKAYSISIEDNLNALPVREKIGLLLKRLGSKNPCLDYWLDLPKHDLELARKIRQEVQKEPGSFIIFNPYAGARFRTLSDYNILTILKEVFKQRANSYVGLVAPPSQRRHIQRLLHSYEEIFRGRACLWPEVSTISQVAALIGVSDLVISVDTSTVHIASAFGKPIVGLYGDDRDSQEKNTIQWAPASPHWIIVKGKNKTNGSIDVNTFDFLEFSLALQEMWGHALQPSSAHGQLGTDS